MAKNEHLGIWWRHFWLKWRPLSWFQFYHKEKFSDWRPFDMILTSHGCHFFGFWCHFSVAHCFELCFWQQNGRFCCHLTINADVIILKMLSLSLLGHKKRSSKGFICLRNFIFRGYSIVMTYLRGFQPLRKYFQPERIGKLFNLGELCLILASIDFVGTNQKIERNNHYSLFTLKYCNFCENIL